ncbi:MAG: putative lipid II flippase FtsW [Acidobacteriota bacterium]|nr:putative lipid II flippase FtsW [Blastocatellia bacterium]MDQ3221267.1 putative lipid II flippase FtsW [Acidobacteriota bacterium]MDQ3490930.1 putative lipid II flippase FtsW [Acidobacteriota bacterium]
MVNKLRIDWFLFAISTALAVFGAAMVYSASAMMALRESQSQFTYFYKQFAFTIVGLAIMYIASKFDYRKYQDWRVVYGIFIFTVICLIAVFAFPSINGATRWIRVGSFSFQPSEMAKITLPIFLAFFLTKHENTVGELKSTVIPCVAALILLAGLIFAEPDFGTAIVLCAIFSAVYFAAGARMVHIATVAAGMFLMGIGAILIAPWRFERLMAFLDPFKHADDAGYQVVQSLYAIGSGGITGEGFAKGQAKLFYLPYPYSDFIFSVVGEELGLIGTLTVVAAFGLILWRGTRAALNAPDRFGMLLGIGIVTGIIVQALFNISVVISILPAKGIPLPFISYGGSSVLVTLFAVGILLNISRRANGKVLKETDRDTVYRRKVKKPLRRPVYGRNR